MFDIFTLCGDMEQRELYYRLALMRVEGIGPVKHRKLIEQAGSARDLFTGNRKLLKSIPGLSPANRMAILHFHDFQRIDEEFRFTEKHAIQILEYDDPQYPQRLKLCADAPPVLFFKGHADLNAKRMVAVIGTRNHSEYGRQVCEEMIEGLKSFEVSIVSGLALGIDAIAHRGSLKHHLPTIGVVAHGLDTIYPAIHRGLSQSMVETGGLLSEYFSGTLAEKGNFPTRNRIVAGMCDAVLIIETDRRGGSMITAEIAYSYNREVYCIPGRVNDPKSKGCHELIRSLKAQLVSNANDLAMNMGWSRPKSTPVHQPSLFLALSETEQALVDLLRKHGAMHLDVLSLRAGFTTPELAASLLNLEMQQVVSILPGKIIALVHG